MRKPADPFDWFFENAYDPAFLIDLKTRKFVSANAAAAAMLGYSLPELLDLSPSAIHPHEIPRLETFVKKVVDHGMWTSDELSCRRKDGRTLPAHLRAAAVHHQNGPAILIILRNLREHKLAELGEGVRRLAHDLRNTLATARLLSERMTVRGDEPVRMNAVATVRAIDRAVQLCKSTLERGNAADPPPERETFLLVDVLEELHATVGEVGNANTKLDDISPRQVRLVADFDQVYRIFLNLVRNAFDAGADCVEINGRNDKVGAVITVTDNGPGLPEYVQANIESEKHSRTEGKSGLGLMIASELCRKHGGDLRVQTTGWDGTTFIFRLPFDDEKIGHTSEMESLGV